MATALGSPWFVQWAPPADIFGGVPFLPAPPTQQRQGFFENFGRGEDPYRGYDEGVNPRDQGPVRSQIQIRQPQPQPQPQIQPQPQTGLVASWQTAPQSSAPLPRRQGAPVYRFLPTLLAAGLLTAPGFTRAEDGTLTPQGPQGPTGPARIQLQRGDQDPPEDPDRDLGGAPPLRTLYHWKQLDFAYDSDVERTTAIESKDFIPENNLPLGLEAWRDKVFITIPRWKPGVPCTLATVPRSPEPKMESPKLRPYPDWSYHSRQGDCTGLTSVFRISIDRCGRLWVLDSGQVEALAVPRQVCPPQLLAFNLTNDKLIGRWPLPKEHVRENSLFTNIVNDIRGDKCDDVHIYFTDVWRYSILVFRHRDEKFWRFNSHLFYPDPLASDYNLHGINFQWTDGVFGISLTPVDQTGDRTLFFHPMSSFREFKMKASLLRNETAVNDSELIAKSIVLAGESRGPDGQVSASAIDRNGVMFYNLVTRDSIGCWDTRKPYKREALGLVSQDEERLIFPNDLKVDSEPRQSVWILSNRLPIFLYRKLDFNDINFRIMREYTDDAVDGTVCDSRLAYVGPLDYQPTCY